ncbi:MAG: hypothetical protein QOG89_1756 [Thermomicrobiales bacterium]|nr:hypothetical protein [Thermomicrobiales bacterium]
MCRSVLTSCLITSNGKRGSRSCGPIGSRVPGWRTGGSGVGRSARMLYQLVGIWSSLRRNFVCSLIAAPGSDRHETPRRKPRSGSAVRARQTGDSNAQHCSRSRAGRPKAGVGEGALPSRPRRHDSVRYMPRLTTARPPHAGLRLRRRPEVRPTRLTRRDGDRDRTADDNQGNRHGDRPHAQPISSDPGEERRH